MDMPIVSVLMSVYNEPLEWIEESINSILNQTFSDFEFIIVNDNPISAELRQFLNDFKNKDSRIKVITNLENLGLTKSLNIGLKVCRGKYIARMDADDISLSERLAKQYDFLEQNPQVIVCGCKIKVFGNFNPYYCDTCFEEDIDIRGQMLLNSGFAHPTVMIRSSILHSHNIKYDETFKVGQDYKMWFDIQSYGQFSNLKEKLLLYRISNNQVSITSSVIQNRTKRIVNEAFIKLWLDSLFHNKSYDYPLIHLRDLTKELKCEEDYKMYSYYLRSKEYREPKLIRALQLFWNRRCLITIKERFIILLLAIRNCLKKKK